MSGVPPQAIGETATPWIPEHLWQIIATANWAVNFFRCVDTGREFEKHYAENLNYLVGFPRPDEVRTYL